MAVLENVSAKQRRISLVWLVGAVTAFLWALTDWLFAWQLPESVSSSLTVLVMGVAMFIDVSRERSGIEIIDPSTRDDL